MSYFPVFIKKHFSYSFIKMNISWESIIKDLGHQQGKHNLCLHGDYSPVGERSIKWFIEITTYLLFVKG